MAAVGGHHANSHPDIPRVGNIGLVLSAGDGPRLGVTGDSLEPLQEFHGIDALAFAVVAPWSKMAETIDFLRAVGPKLADRKSTRLNSSHVAISYAVFC